MLGAFFAETRIPDFSKLVRETVPRIPPGRVLTYTCLAPLGLPVPHKCSLGSVMLVKSSVFVA